MAFIRFITVILIAIAICKELENQKAWVEKWDGSVPQVVTSSDSNMYYGLNTEISE